jgi:hypothetical protein
MVNLEVWEELLHQHVDQMIHALIPLPFQPYALQHMVISDHVYILI